MGTNWANTPGCKPGNSSAVNLHKSIAAGSSMPSSPRKTKVPGMKGSSTGTAKTPGMGYR
ncbi:MAG: hypothetical protein V4510_13375 [bacterium]